MAAPANTVLGIDPGTAVTGFGVVEADRRRRGKLVQCGVIRTSADAALPRRLRELYEAVAELIQEFNPVAMAIEDVFQGKNVRSALTLGQARGAIIVAAARKEVAVAEYTPRQIKRAVAGAGGATKEQVAFMVQRHLRLLSPPTPLDAADGVAVALCHAFIGALPGVPGLPRVAGMARGTKVVGSRVTGGARRAGGSQAQKSQKPGGPKTQEPESLATQSGGPEVAGPAVAQMPTGAREPGDARLMDARPKVTRRAKLFEGPEAVHGSKVTQTPGFALASTVTRPVKVSRACNPPVSIGPDARRTGWSAS